MPSSIPLPPAVDVPGPGAPPAVGLRQVGLLLLACTAACLPALLGHTVVAQVNALSSLAASPQPYWQPQHAGLLYLATPVVVLSSFALYLVPGALLTLAFRQAQRLTEWFLLAFATSLLLAVLLGTLSKLLQGTPLQAATYLVMWVGTAALAGLFLLLRCWQGHSLSWPLGPGAERRRLVWMGLATGAGVTTLLPKIFWENFNLDGIEAFEFGRSLSAHVLPHWDLYGGVFGFYHNFVLFAYPNHWFITLLGPCEAAVRLPFLLYVLGLFAALLLLIEQNKQRLCSVGEEAVLWLGLALYTVVQTYNTNYEPFFADLAEMAATDSLWVLCFLGACYALWTSRWGWLWVWGLMTHLASPGSTLLLGSLFLMTWWSHAPNRQQQLRHLGSVIGGCVLIGLLYTGVYSRFVLSNVNDQFSFTNMLRRLYPPTLHDWVRGNALLFPSGLLPTLALCRLQRRDHITWCLTGVTLITFAVLYMQAWTALHQFTPVMVLPVVVFWRQYLDTSQTMQRCLLLAMPLTTVGALLLSCPQHWQINHAIRDFGYASEYAIGDYEHAYEPAAAAASSVYALLPRDYRLDYPQQPWGVDAYAWLYYATRPKPPGTVVNYVLQAAAEHPPPGLAHVATVNDVAVYVRDIARWQHHRDREVPRVVISPLYEPILRRTYAFFRAYVARQQTHEQQKQAPPGK